MKRCSARLSGAGGQVGAGWWLAFGFTPPGLQPTRQEEYEEDDDPDQVEDLSVHVTLLCCVHVRRERVAPTPGSQGRVRKVR